MTETSIQEYLEIIGISRKGLINAINIHKTPTKTNRKNKIKHRKPKRQASSLLLKNYKKIVPWH